jgi:hypothetical protein
VGSCGKQGVSTDWQDLREQPLPRPAEVDRARRRGGEPQRAQTSQRTVTSAIDCHLSSLREKFRTFLVFKQPLALPRFCDKNAAPVRCLFLAITSRGRPNLEGTVEVYARQKPRAGPAAARHPRGTLDAGANTAASPATLFRVPLRPRCDGGCGHL